MMRGDPQHTEAARLAAGASPRPDEEMRIDMKRHFGVMAFVLAIMLGGCKITSTTPDPAQSVIMNPGEEKTFTVTSIGGPVVSNTWCIPDDYRHEYGTVSSYTYAPQTKDIGRHTIVCFVEDGYFGIKDATCPGPCINFGFIATPCTAVTWEVIVSGVVIDTPSTVVAPGENKQFKATVYPEGDYTYAWFMDQTPVGTGVTLLYSPDPTQTGSHTLRVTVTGAQGPFTASTPLRE
jgi:hypothetical protein